MTSVKICEVLLSQRDEGNYSSQHNYWPAAIAADRARHQRIRDFRGCDISDSGSFENDAIQNLKFTHTNNT